MSRKTDRIAGALRRAEDGGFTLIELLVAMIVGAVILAIAVPNLTAFVTSSRLRASQSELVGALTLARSEATKRGVNVVVESLATGTPIAGTEFNAGWRVFVDPNLVGSYNGSAGQIVVREYPPVVGDFRFGTETAVTRAAFNSRGFLTTGEVVFTVCGKAGVTKGYRIRLEQVGIADVVEGPSCS
jgi:type IV fimbrial biogenesis protein FimT